MTLTPGFRRAMAWTVVSGILSLAWTYWPASSPTAVVVASSADSVPMAEAQ
jgi:hypothetical protein